MKVTDAEAQSRRRLEPATWSVHTDCWGRKRVLGRKYQCAPVLTILVRCSGRTSENIMPSNLFLVTYFHVLKRRWEQGSLTREYWTPMDAPQCMAEDSFEYFDTRG
jgi:hypothetical protein